MGEVIMKQPDGKYSTTDSSNMIGGDYHTTINASDGTIPEEDIKRYYDIACLLYTSPSPRDRTRSRMPSSA